MTRMGRPSCREIGAASGQTWETAPTVPGVAEYFHNANAPAATPPPQSGRAIPRSRRGESESRRVISRLNGPVREPIACRGGHASQFSNSSFTRIFVARGASHGGDHHAFAVSRLGLFGRRTLGGSFLAMRIICGSAPARRSPCGCGAGASTFWTSRLRGCTCQTWNRASAKSNFSLASTPAKGGRVF